MSSFAMVESLYPMLPIDSQAEPSRSPNLSRMSTALPFHANNAVSPRVHSPVRTEPAVQSADMSSYKIVLGYDFGTTFSGASYAYCQNEEVLDIERWPNRRESIFPKVPTALLYEKGDSTNVVEWGHGAKMMYAKPGAAANYDLLTGFKLNLDENLKRPPLPNGMSTAKLISDYLRCLHSHVVRELSRQFARNYTEEQFRYCLTVPAMWSDRAKSKMRTAAIDAGLISAHDPPDRLMITSEPEAGALYCEKSCKESNLTEGDRFMICDAGGGTIDLIVFEIEEPREGKTRLKEITKGMGESCGSIFLDQRFETLLREKLGEEIINVSANSMLKMMDQFIDSIKPEFDGNENEPQYLSLPASVNLNVLTAQGAHVEDAMLVISGAELKSRVFDPVVNRVIDLIETQLNQITGKTLDTIFLVGGFGSSSYLYDRVRTTFQPRIPQILYPARASLAIVRGAVHYGLHPQPISSRILRRTYGINAGLPYDELLDPPSSRFVRPDGSVRCITRFLTFACKGDAIRVDQCIREQMYIYYNTIYSTDLRLYATENPDEPRWYNQAGVQQIAALEIPIPRMAGVERGQRVNYEVRMYFGRNEIRMEAEFPGGNVFAVKCDFDAVSLPTS
ncbi:hypothetical protein K450DRAFT_236526 [Umbelopsis ramanniana AG]|uniref:Uncharacterized protein n=1 Tax=Umbelopsis ramanniana AG TaxID=1314678 RepID=A0AAD5EB15_UMBRA|nr:uncharacterized protein K450DRAFT_236526 [Umbelopsis ramanniana AG]KAI8580626.1 hypothetical protein K450DRAFT_236526 [Umbelopsis ramanniana AG]